MIELNRDQDTGDFSEDVKDVIAGVALDAAERVALWAFRQRITPTPDDETTWLFWLNLEQSERDRWIGDAEVVIRGDLLGDGGGSDV